MRKQTILLLLVALVWGCKKPNFLQQNANTDQTSNSKLAINTFSGPDFMIAVIPDTQYYTWRKAPDVNGGGTLSMFDAQINWIRSHRVDSNIVYVAHLGDITDTGSVEPQWIRAKSVWYKLDTPLVGQTAIPNGVAVGNHDQTPHGWAVQDADQTKTTLLYNQYFGVSHFSTDISGNPRTYYHSRTGYGNDSHYDLISAGGMDLVIIYTEYNNPNLGPDNGLNDWCDGVLATYPDRKAIIISHSMVDYSSNFSSDGGKALYTRIKARKNVVMMLGGHWAQPGGSGDSPGPKGEGYVDTTSDGHRVRAMLSDYQQREWGGNGKMRLIKFSPANDRFTVMTYSPFTNTYETDSDSYFTHPLLNDNRASRTCDFNNDGKTEWGLFKAGGVWKRPGMTDVTWGTASGDIPLTTDFDDDGTTDIAVDKADGRWRIKNGDQTLTFTGFVTGDVPVPADYNGNGLIGQAYWRNSNHKWYIGSGNPTGVSYGATGDIPVPGDYDGDGNADLAVFRPSNGNWYIQGIYDAGILFGNPVNNPIPTPGDYNGDGKIDISVYNPVSGDWAVKTMTTVTVVPSPAAGDIPVPGDYDGDGKTNQAIFRPSNKTLYVKNVDGTVTTTVVSSYTSGDKLLNLPYHIRKFFPGF